MERYALIIGAMKAGTTTLFDHLAGHPAVAPSQPKEPGFFAFDELYSKGREYYHSLFRVEDGAHRIRLDGSTDYAKHPYCGDVPARLKAFGGEFRLIYSLRHPLRRIESHAQHVQHKRREVGRIDSDRADHSLDSGVSPVSLAISRYAAQIDQYADYFDKGALLITSVERMAKAPEAAMREICAHLDLDPSGLPASVERKNAGARVRRGRDVHPLWRAASAIGPLRSLARAVTPKEFRNRLRDGARVQTQAKGRFTLTPGEEAQILEMLTPDLRRLRDRYGFDVEGEWGINL
ncbi:MAG: sulfotransferase domain-containing protein [Parvularculaceae bacterium]